ncbi:protein FAR1-RELATED SEQUENCE 5-like [Arachis ipaensis]|uniref:protein FAR1-RELATED SEQUENCE 5-like n=1 Tax=Arachis ipaensis TaxID=130454 RepID=UPI0007AF1CDA|nr:protein FAR1-RELATED SEQUENCE 5-like [Arachis ipaensis]
MVRGWLLIKLCIVTEMDTAHLVKPSAKYACEAPDKQNDQAGIRPSKTYQALANAAGGPANLTFTEKDVRNYISRHLRIFEDETDPKELLKHFSQMKELNPNFFFEIDVDKNHSIRNVFWADAWCRDAWEYFGNVVMFDTTYKTNRYDMLFGYFVGVNHHEMSTLLGCDYCGIRTLICLLTDICGCQYFSRTNSGLA